MEKFGSGGGFLGFFLKNSRKIEKITPGGICHPITPLTASSYAPALNTKIHFQLVKKICSFTLKKLELYLNL